ncbi:PREDICTED: cytochrome b-c1 complex subunit 9-like [Elephantulus edwardii]|uniref:cytochrome b-c1 complex subunit 9-like n=1 Tax=Elephantulus edwardii TaxID=28737 RepID=UPI0003F0C7F8|nr:PREDICTED: cytochrome b-c1 complex subunit 9-like [Elephantulus edwardii]
MAGPTFTANLYSSLFLRNPTFSLTIAVGALFFKRALGQGADMVYKHITQGKLWKHIKHKYQTQE